MVPLGALSRLPRSFGSGALDLIRYLYTWSNTRLWRKNRSPAPAGSTCIGTDLNRNFNDHWGQGGSSTSPCSDTYMGASAGSEPEVQATSDYFRLNLPIYGAIDWCGIFLLGLVFPPCCARACRF